MTLWTYTNLTDMTLETSARHNLSTSDISLGADRDLGIPQALMSQR